MGPAVAIGVLFAAWLIIFASVIVGVRELCLWAWEWACWWRWRIRVWRRSRLVRHAGHAL
jgi:hypothetical protein